MSIQNNVEMIREKVEQACSRAGSGEVTLIAVSKTRSPEEVREAFRCGIRHFGENRIQEALPKIETAAVDAVWHLVGHLQSNKANKAAQAFDWVQSIDKPATAQKLGRYARELGRTLKVLIEVNTSGEASKNGIAPQGVEALAQALAAVGGLQPLGLMTIGPWGGTEAENRRAFALLRSIRDRLQQQFPGYQELSMGMSADFEQAILEGATMVRIGSALFGPRTY